MDPKTLQTSLELSLLAAAQEAPDQLALIAEGKRFPFAELAERMRPALNTLAGLPISSGQRIALQATNRVETLLMLYACMEQGIPFVPIHPRLTSTEVQTLLADAEPAHVFCDDDLGTLVKQNNPLLAILPAKPARDAALAILYTSGTTGKPKGAILSRASFLASAWANERNLGWRTNDRWLLCLPLCHIGGLSIAVRCLMARKCVVLEPRFDPDAVLNTLAREQVTLLSVVPTMLKALLECDRTNVLARLRAVLIGGASISLDLLKECSERSVQALATYGLTEACSQVTAQHPQYPPAAEPGSGKVLPGIELFIANEANEPIPTGQVGRIRIRGLTLMTGYLGASPLSSAWFDTGDLGMLDKQGRLHVHARRTDLIVTGGENVYPAEVEQVLETFPGVSAALVFGVPDETWGALVAALIVPSSNQFNESNLFEQMTSRLAKHKQPRLIAFVSELPLLSNGKLNRKSAFELFKNELRPWKKEEF